MNNDIHSMKLNKIYEIDSFNRILRVPGGWIYNQEWHTDGSAENTMTTSVFVPFSNEFNLFSEE